MTRQKKWLKRILLLLAIALTMVIAAGMGGIYLYRATPSWYRSGKSTPQQTKDAANRADQKLLEVFSWAAAAQAQWIRHAHGQPASAPAVGPETVSFDEEEINSFFRAWDSPEESVFQSKLSRYFSGGRLVLADGQVILAGQSSELGTVASAEFSPTIDAQGRLRLSLDGLKAGLLPVPMSSVSDPLARLRRLLGDMLVEYQESAKIDQTLTANGSAVAASWTRLMLDSLTDQSSEPVVYIPFDLGNLHRALPVKLTAAKVSEGSITVTLEPLQPQDRAAVLEHLKQPYSEPATAAH
jgi:hypothetical protein